LRIVWRSRRTPTLFSVPFDLVRVLVAPEQTPAHSGLELAIGVLRLRGCFATRSNLSAQDDSLRILLHTFLSCPLNSVFRGGLCDSKSSHGLFSRSFSRLRCRLRLAPSANWTRWRRRKPVSKTGRAPRWKRDMAKKANQAPGRSQARHRKAAQAGDRVERVRGQNDREHALAGRDQEDRGDRKAGAQRQRQDEGSLLSDLDDGPFTSMATDGTGGTPVLHYFYFYFADPSLTMRMP
jgi:hypothetical protein